MSRPALGPTKLPIQWVPGDLSLREKWPGYEADHSPPSSAKVKNAWSYTSTPQYAFMAWCSVKKHRDNFTFTFKAKLSLWLIKHHIMNTNISTYMKKLHNLKQI
jgi:hypothetical protein